MCWPPITYEGLSSSLEAERPGWRFSERVYRHPRGRILNFKAGHLRAVLGNVNPSTRSPKWVLHLSRYFVSLMAVCPPKPLQRRQAFQPDYVHHVSGSAARSTAGRRCRSRWTLSRVVVYNHKCHNSQVLEGPDAVNRRVINSIPCLKWIDPSRAPYYWLAAAPILGLHSVS